MTHVPSDIEIAQSATLRPISQIAAQLGFTDEDLLSYGPHKAKVTMTALRRALSHPTSPDSRLILVTAMTPTPYGEGKTTCSIGLTQALRQLGKKATVALREPSLGPVFGVKGGAAGGGYSQVLPMEDINLHFTGDLHAVTSAHNLVAAVLDNHLHFKHEPWISIRDIFWRRVMDMNDRSMRELVLGLHGNGVPREGGFDITAASEIMAILCLSRDYDDLKERVGKLCLGLTLSDKRPFLARELKAEGAVGALLKEALLPNIVQTLEGGPALIHGGPFANIAQGANSVLATRLALATSDYAVTEAGFGCDLGAEKFVDIVSPYGGFAASAVVLVATIRALKHHGGVSKTALSTPDAMSVVRGRENLEKHIENVRKFGAEPVVAVNRFAGDTEEELNAALEICREAGAEAAVVNVWAEGGRGALELAERVVNVTASSTRRARPIYDWKAPVKDKIRTIATEIYGARDVFFLPKAKKDIELAEQNGFGALPICMAKTQNSLSDDPKKLGRPRDFTLTVREMIVSSGAGFLVPMTGEIMRMPGLPEVPSATHVDIDNEGRISGLS
jgi:formate--tetrahydrofolate ligase